MATKWINSNYSYVNQKQKQSQIAQDSRFLQSQNHGGGGASRDGVVSGVTSGINVNTDPRFQAPSTNANNAKVNNTNEYGLNMNAPSYARAAVASANTYKPPTTNNGGGGGGASATTAGFAPSQTYLKAMEYTNALLEQLSSGRTNYTDRINSLMDQIVNRDKFSYDPSTDTLFQNMLQGYMASGQTAMQDTMGQAAGLTGGYGSSYATSAANQAYNQYIQDAYANLPDYYSLALDAYNQEGAELYNQLGMYQTADDVEYNRLASAYSANAQAAANLYDQEYNNYWQTQNFNESSRQWAAEMGYKKSQAAQSQKNWEAEYAASLAKTASEGAKLTSPSSKQYETALGLYNKGGDADDSAYAKYLVELDGQGIDVNEIDSYVASKGDATEVKRSSMGNPFTKKDNKYVDQWGREYTYEEAKKLGLI